jgi:hypothetical protein
MQQPTPVPLAVGYRPDTELEDFGVVMFSEPDGAAFGFGISTEAPTTELLLSLAFGLQENFPELSAAWGEARPACPGHGHPMQPREHRASPSPSPSPSPSARSSGAALLLTASGDAPSGHAQPCR